LIKATVNPAPWKKSTPTISSSNSENICKEAFQGHVKVIENYLLSRSAKVMTFIFPLMYLPLPMSNQSEKRSDYTMRS
jgi:hypothetical protein